MSDYVTIAPANSFDRWPNGLKQELQDNAYSPIVGSVLVAVFTLWLALRRRVVPA